MIDAPELLALLQREANDALDEGLNEERALALDFYFGKLFDDDEPGEGRSKLVTRDVAEVVDYMAVSVLRTMVSGDRIVDFEAKSPETVEEAKAATELVAWQFMRQLPGYAILSDFLKAGLLEKSGVAKVWVEPTERFEMQIVTATEVDTRKDIIAADITDEVTVNDDGAVEALYQAKVRVPGEPRYMVAAVANDEFDVAQDARTLDGAFYIRHKTRVRKSQLLKMGFAPADVEECWGNYAKGGEQLSTARDTGRNRKERDNQRNGMAQGVWLDEEYVFFDWNGDGVEERLRVHRVGTKILSVVEVTGQPFVLWTPFPMPHRLIGQSLADKVLDIQVTRSVLLRGAIDNLAYSNVPRVTIDMADATVAEMTIDDTLHHRPGVPIRFKGTRPEPWAIPFTAGASFTALDMMSGEKESRTGITRLNQGLDADTLNKTATGTALMQAQGQQIEEYVARNFAEGVAEIFEKMLLLMREHGLKAKLRIDGEFQDVNPSEWSGDMNMTIRVGLGSGRREQRLEYDMMILGMQREAVANGMRLTDESKIYATAKSICDNIGKDVNQHFIDPDTLDPAEPKPDPEMAEVQGKLALEEQRQAQKEAQAQFDRDLAERQQAAEELLAVRRADFEEDMAIRRAQFEANMAIRAVPISDSDLTQYHPGGDLDR